MNVIEIDFPVLGDTVKVDHSYALYSAISRKVPALHAPEASFSIGSINGEPIGRGLIRISVRSRLRCRLPADSIPTILSLAGQMLEVGRNRIRVGVPNVRAIVPSKTLWARLVVMKLKGVEEPSPEQFLDAAQRRLSEVGIIGTLTLPRINLGERAGEPRRRVLRLKGRSLVGFALRINGLSSDHSLQLQANSPFGKRRMGCGFFVPVREREGET